MSIITIEFTIPEVVKLISCCNQAIINGEETLKTVGNTSCPVDFVRGSIDKILDIKSKIKNIATKNLGSGRQNSISLALDITDWIKLNGCCNAALESEEKMIVFLPSSSSCISVCHETIKEINVIKNKIKYALTQYYDL